MIKVSHHYSYCNLGPVHDNHECNDFDAYICYSFYINHYYKLIFRTIFKNSIRLSHSCRLLEKKYEKNEYKDSGCACHMKNFNM